MKRIAWPAWASWLWPPLMIALLGLHLGLASGCGGAVHGPELGHYTLGFIGRGDNPDYEALLERSANRGARELANVYGEIEIRWAAPGGPEGLTQAEIIHRFIEDGVDGIALSYGENGATEAIDAAIEAGVPIITFERDSPGSSRITYLGGEEALYGFMMAQTLYAALQGEGRYVALTSDGETQRQRLEGLELELQSFEGIESVEVLRCESEADAPGVLREAAERHEEVGAWAMLDDWLLRTPEGREALAALPGFKVAVSLGEPKTWPHLEAGLVDVLIVPGRQDWGAASVRILLDIIVNEKPFPDRTGIKPIRLTADGLDRYRIHWANWFDENDEDE